MRWFFYSQCRFVATTDCAVGDDPHWQCGGQWQSYDELEPGDYVAICGGSESATYIGCYETDQYVQLSSVTAANGFLVCNSEVTLGRERTSCADHSFTKSENFGAAVLVAGPDEGGSGGAPVGGDSGEGELEPVESGSSGLSFVNVTLLAFPNLISNQSPVSAPFEADLGYINDDGCLDGLITSNATDQPDGIYLQNVLSVECSGTFSYPENSYSLTGPPSRRITSWLMLFDLNGDSYTDILGGDVDGNPSLAAIQGNQEGVFIGVTGYTSSAVKTLAD